MKQLIIGLIQDWPFHIIRLDGIAELYFTFVYAQHLNVAVCVFLMRLFARMLNNIRCIRVVSHLCAFSDAVQDSLCSRMPIRKHRIDTDFHPYVSVYVFWVHPSVGMTHHTVSSETVSHRCVSNGAAVDFVSLRMMLHIRHTCVSSRQYASICVELGSLSLRIRFCIHHIEMVFRLCALSCVSVKHFSV